MQRKPGTPSKLHNGYEELINPILYGKIPKTVLAAIVVSWASTRGDDETFEGIDQKILDEWAALHGNGIVPQRSRH